MSPSVRRLLPAFIAVFTLAPGAAEAQRGDYPHLRAALHELRDARAELKAARDCWPTGHRDRAMSSIDDAILSVRSLLAVKDLNGFRGVERGADFYKRLGDRPRLRAAVLDLRQARAELQATKSDFGGRKEQALDEIDVAIGDLLRITRIGTRPNTTSAVVSSGSPSAFGQPVVFAVRVGDSANVATSGTVSFFDGTRLLGFGLFDPSTSEWSLTVSNLGLGRHSITAAYSGNYYYARSSSQTQPRIQIVNRAN